jgi:hypothetical protein
MSPPDMVEDGAAAYGVVIDAPFARSGVHPVYHGLPWPDLVARLQVDLMRASPAQLDAISHVLRGAGRAVVRQIG